MKVNILVPESLSEITLEQYQKFDLINNEENQDSNFLLHKTVEIFCNIDLRDIATIKYKHVSNIINSINSIFSKKPKFIDKFTMDNVQYGFIPNLDDISLGEYIDLDNNISEWSTMHKAMSVLFRPITKIKNSKYQIEDYKGMDSSEKMKRMPVDVVMGSLVFFYNLNNELLKTTLSFLNQETKKELTLDQREVLAKSGIGISQSMLLVKEMLPNLMRLPN